MEMKKLTIILFVFIALLITANAALAAEEVKLSGSISLVEDVEQKYIITLEDGSVKNEITALTALKFNGGDVKGAVLGKDNITFSVTPTANDAIDSTKNSNVKLSVDLVNKSNAPVKKEFNITVKPAIEVSNLKVNGKLYEEGKTTHSAKPNEPVKIELDVKNNLPESVTDVEMVMTSTQLDLLIGDISQFKTAKKVNIQSGKTIPLTFEKTLDLKAKEGPHDVTLTVTGLDIRKSKGSPTVEKSQKMDFKLNVVQDFADVVITETPKLSDTELVCSDETTVTVTLKNKGNTKEDDVEVQAYVSNTLVGKSALQALGPNEVSQPIEFKIKSKELHHGTNDITLKLSYRNGEKTSSHPTPLTVNNKPCLIAPFSPKETTLTRLKYDPAVTLSVTTAVQGQSVTWFVKKDGDNLEPITTPAYPFQWTEAGTYEVTAVVNEDAKESHTWTITVLGKPKTSYKTNLKDNQELTSVSDFSVEDAKTGSKIVFTTPVDVSNIADLDKVIVFGSNYVAVDSKTAPGLGNKKSATVTFGSKINDPLILKSNDFKTGTLNDADFSACTDCVLDEKASTTSFTVSGFSTYFVKEQKPADLSVSTVTFPVGKAGETVTAEFTVKNTGTVEDLVVVGINHAIPSTYKPTVDVPAFPLKHGAEQKVKLSVTIPSTAKAGELFNFGDLTVSTFDKIGTEIVKKQAISFSLESFLSIEKVEINGKTSGKLRIDEDNEVEVWVKNKYTEKIENIQITVRVLDSSEYELADEDSSDFDLKVNEEDSESVDVDISGEDFEDDSYTIEIVAEGDDLSGNPHTVTKVMTVSLDVESHDLVVNNVVASQTSLECSRQASLYVTVENKGKEDEKDVEIRVSNPTLGVDVSKKDLKLDKFSDKDNSYKATFGLDFTNAKAGTYTLTSEVLRNGKSQDSEDIILTVKDCGASSTTTSTTTGGSTTLGAENSVVKALQEQLAALQNQQVTPQSTVKTSFRDSNTYPLLLGALTILIFIAAILALVVGAARRK